jgi:hypothetical protein
MDRLVELFVQSARFGESGEPSSLSTVPQDGGRLDADGIEHGVASIEKMMNSEDGMKMGANSSATFVCLAMALEEKPLLQAGATRCYEKALELLDRRRQRLRNAGGSWERATVLQQLGAVCLKQGNAEKAVRWLEECGSECADAEGHPREAVLFGGAFNTQQTRLDFIGTIEKLLAKAYKDMGDMTRAAQHYEEVQRLSRMQSCDAVERAVARGEAQQPQGATSSSMPATKASRMSPKELWAATSVEEHRLSEYRFLDEGPVVVLMWDLNEHLGIGEEASKIVDNLSHFRVTCESDCVDVRVRVQRENGSICQYQLLLQPLAHDIIPEDTVPRLKGREAKRRLEVKLFKRDKQIGWTGDFVKFSGKPKASDKSTGSHSKPADSTKGTMLNPLSTEELANLPRPFTGSGDNRPSLWQTTPVLLHKEEAQPLAKEKLKEENASHVPMQTPLPTGSTPVKAESVHLPAWVSCVQERKPAGSFEVDVFLGAEAGESVSMEDLELEGDELSGLRLRLRGAAGSALELSIPPGVESAAMKARWRRKTRVLELRFPAA